MRADGAAIESEPTDAAAEAAAHLGSRSHDHRHLHGRWFAIESGLAAGIAAFFASQALILITAGGILPVYGGAIAAGLVIAVIEAVLVTGFGLLAWAEVESRRLPARSRGFAVLIRVAIGTFVFGIAASGLLGSWQAWLLASSITLVAAGVGGYIAARCIWRDEAERVPRREP
jgi:hypothetical protein